ncbi:hypothetical protein Dda_7031 [Drechslerella dactyloides]|uniref:Uncharacterized protein n=1 Tax=Drechslerella dactyloides TaxID=74499 RepID=A0AAD6NFZ4_DREDA|nr:hypothetical protein Dda_7031 [Drechslerella dactyloides]
MSLPIISGIELARKVLKENGMDLDERVRQSSAYRDHEERMMQQAIAAEERQEAEDRFLGALEEIRHEGLASQQLLREERLYLFESNRNPNSKRAKT